MEPLFVSAFLSKHYTVAYFRRLMMEIGMSAAVLAGAATIAAVKTKNKKKNN